MRRTLLILFIVLGVTPVFAQLRDETLGGWWSPGPIMALPTLDSLTGFRQSNAIGFDFDHTRSLYNWGGKALVFAPKTVAILQTPSVFFSSEARSQLREDTRTRTNEGTAYIQSIYPIVTNAFGLTATLFGTTYSLNSSPSVFGTIFSSIQRLSDGYGLAGLKYLPNSDLELSASGGAAFKSFLYGRSSGSIIQARGELSPVNVAEGSLLDMAAQLDERRFPSLGEAGRNDSARIHYVTALGDGGSNEAEVLFNLKRQDFYFSVDSLTPYVRQERNEMTVLLRNSLHYPISGRRIDWFLDGTIIPHSVTRSTQGIDFAGRSQGFLTSSTFLLPSTTSTFDLDIGTRLVWNLPSADTLRRPTLTGGIRFTENSETNDVSSTELSFATTDLLKKLSGIFEATSFDGKQSVVSFDALIPMFMHDLFLASVSSRLFRYDTPSEDNHDDRDELYINTAFGYSHFFSDELSGFSQLRFSRSHLVYLKSDRSAQNFVSKTISLTLGGAYNTRGLQNVISGEVFSNYAVYDFVLPTAGPTGSNDYLIRGINAYDSLLISLGHFPLITSATGLFESNLNFRLYERGAYNVGAFTERPLLSTAEISGDITYDISERTSAAPALIKIGARVFYQLRNTPKSAIIPGLVLQERVNRFGPLMTIVFDPAGMTGLRLYASVWYSILRHDEFSQSSFTTTNLTEGRIGVRWVF